MHSRYGEVMSLRLPPEDIMSCIDAVNSLGISTENMSLSMVVRLGISAAMEGLRRSGTLPTRDGFEYLQMVEPFGRASRSKRASAAVAVNSAHVNLAMKDILRPGVRINGGAVQPNGNRTQSTEDWMDELIVQKGRLLVNAEELGFKRKTDPANFTPEEQMRLDDLKGQIQQIDEKLNQIDPSS